jgi:hypothetical protein
MKNKIYFWASLFLLIVVNHLLIGIGGWEFTGRVGATIIIFGIFHIIIDITNKKNRNKLLLLWPPLSVALFLYALNITYIAKGGNPIGLLGNPESIWFTIIPGGIGLSGLFLTLIILPIIFCSDFKNTQQGNFSWKSLLGLGILVEIVGLIMNLPLGYFAFITLPTSIIFFIIFLVIFTVRIIK